MQPIITFLIMFSSLVIQSPQESSKAEYRIEEIVRVLEVGDHDVLPGVIRPRNEVTLSSSFDILLGEICVQEGDRVRKGQVVAVLDDRVVRAALNLAQTQADRNAQVEHAQAVLKKSEDSLSRIRKAWEQQAAAEAELIDAQSDYEIAITDLRNAQESQTEAAASLELAQTRLEEHYVRAPFDGVVVRIHEDPGAMVSAGNPLVEIISDDGLCVDLHLPMSIADHLKAGEHYALMIDDLDLSTVVGRVRYIEPRVDPVSKTIRVVFDLGAAESTARLYAGVITRPASRLPSLTEDQIEALAAALMGVKNQPSDAIAIGQED
ncbi:MAG: efflux RND transporter periplasmic adaptor subunit [Phycisphaerales bacterium]|nr:efflux RND transporter periplasmic adaptor subunit [Phycisphaerales bacterium]